MSLLENITNFVNLDPIQALWLLWLIMFLIFLVFSMILSREWRNFGLQNNSLHFAEFVYYIMSVFFLGFSAISIILFNANLQ
jgi:hypothetical protein